MSSWVKYISSQIHTLLDMESKYVITFHNYLYTLQQFYDGPIYYHIQPQSICEAEYSLHSWIHIKQNCAAPSNFPFSLRGSAVCPSQQPCKGHLLNCTDAVLISTASVLLSFTHVRARAHTHTLRLVCLALTVLLPASAYM